MSNQLHRAPDQASYRLMAVDLYGDHLFGRTAGMTLRQDIASYRTKNCRPLYAVFVRTHLVKGQGGLCAAPKAAGEDGATGVRDAAQFLSDRLDELEWIEGDMAATCRDYFGHVDPAHARLRTALAERPAAPPVPISSNGKDQSDGHRTK